jgi:regulatory protein
MRNATGGPSGTGRPGQRLPKKATAKHLENVALWYLQRFAASADSLRLVLLRRVGKSVRAHDTDRAEGAALVEDIVARFRASGLLDDRLYAEGRARSLHRRGISVRGIRARLGAKGVGAGDIEAALAALSEDAAEPDLAAAIAYASRRRIGFGYDIARRVIETASVEELEAESGG